MLAQLLLVTLLASAAIAAPTPLPLTKDCKYSFRVEKRDLSQLVTTDTVELKSAYGTTLNWDSDDEKACWDAAYKSGHQVAVMEHEYLGFMKVAPTFRCHFKSVPMSPEYPGRVTLLDTVMYGAVKYTFMLRLGHYTIPGYNVQVDKAVAGMTDDQFKAKYEHCDVVSEFDDTVECKVFDKVDNKMVILGSESNCLAQ